MLAMGNEVNVFDSRQVATQLEMSLDALQMWLSRNPEYRPKRRFSGDDLLWTAEDIERVREARATRQRKAVKT